MSLDPSIYEGLAAFQLALRQFLAFSETATCAAGVTAQQYQAMLVIQTSPRREIMIGEFAGQMLLKPNGAVQMVNRLVSAGLVKRSHSPTDRRSVIVSMTSKGAGFAGAIGDPARSRNCSSKSHYWLNRLANSEKWDVLVDHANNGFGRPSQEWRNPQVFALPLFWPRSAAKR